MDYEVINKQAYDANSDYYSNIYNNIKLGDERELINMFMARSSKVLDLGSGNGFFAKFLSVKLLPRLSQSQRAVGLYASGIKSIILN